MPGKFDDLGSYAFYRQMGHEPYPDDMHDGDPGFHTLNVFGQNDKDPEPAKDALGFNTDIVVKELPLAGRGIELSNLSRRQREQDARDDMLADEWLKQHDKGTR